MVVKYGDPWRRCYVCFEVYNATHVKDCPACGAQDGKVAK